MIAAPRPRLGQFDFGLTSGLAKNIVDQAEPVTRRVINEERTKYADALIGWIPWASGAAMSALAAYYLVPPEKKNLKFAGYAGAAGLAGVGSLFTIAALSSPAQTQAPPAQVPGSVQAAATQAAQAVVAEAEPKVRAIVDQERVRLSSALQAGLPLEAAALLALLATALMVKPENPTMKAVGYAASVGLLAGGLWVTLENEK